MRREKILFFFLNSLSRLFPGGMESFLLEKKKQGKEKYFLYRLPFFLYHLQVALALRKSGLFSKGVFRYTSPRFREIQKSSPLFPLVSRNIFLLSPLAKTLLSEAYFYAKYGSSMDPDLLPGLAFSPQKYLEENREVKGSGINPLYHFITAGYRQGKAPFSFLPVPLEKEAYRKCCQKMQEKLKIRLLPENTLSSISTPSREAPGKIAIHIHLYYREMLPVFLPFLAKIPFPFDLYFSIREGEEGEFCRDTLEKELPEMENYFWEAVPNRGRDIAPLLCTFGKKLAADYDFFCHLHTKKSPHNPGLKKWTGFLLDSLLGSEEKIRGILSLLKRDGRIVYPAMKEDWEPDPLTFWGAAAFPAEQLLKKAGKSLKDYPIIDYPHGNMFWAKGEYLKPLLALGLSGKDFPPEPIGEDGSSAHILEHIQLILSQDLPGTAYCLTDSPCGTLHKAPDL